MSVPTKERQMDCISARPNRETLGHAIETVIKRMQVSNRFRVTSLYIFLKRLYHLSGSACSSQATCSVQGCAVSPPVVQKSNRRSRQPNGAISGKVIP